ncbi:hypothetical protein GCM10011571_09180 [Marinithermofilum abyssi]|uniref:Protein kinase domain-containing protein n=1 Tax=Marinithermofilum abyssi TaxID=1571185 RepID=A0A8J2VGV9_9BACL|nr:hypothetical protein [Marinithermofilum abyssi]GGE10037.1 hypothetical protein GCM10011571_09180 [Marinithermofilum abyssi]
MIRQKNQTVRYYERFEVEDVLTFFTGQLIQARSTDGARVLLQEIKLIRPLPPGSKELLYNIQHPHMLSVLDVIMEKGVVVLVHPMFTGEPLPLIVNKQNPMEPFKALNVYRKLIRTMIDLNRLPMPVWTVLDPRNILMSGDQPFVLFCGLKRYTPQPKRDQRNALLYYLLAGQHPNDVKYRHQKLSKPLRRVPAPIRELALELVENQYTPEEILR